MDLGWRSTPTLIGPKQSIVKFTSYIELCFFKTSLASVDLSFAKVILHLASFYLAYVQSLNISVIWHLLAGRT
jgi:hypothetical protein